MFSVKRFLQRVLAVFIITTSLMWSSSDDTVTALRVFLAQNYILGLLWNYFVSLI